jgi:hypothetical protein
LCNAAVRFCSHVDSTVTSSSVKATKLHASAQLLRFGRRMSLVLVQRRNEHAEGTCDRTSEQHRASGQ